MRGLLAHLARWAIDYTAILLALLLLIALLGTCG